MRAALVAALFILLITVGILRTMGRTWWCKCATPHPFVVSIWSEHNSQHLLDPYTFSHIQHGLVLFALLAQRTKILLGDPRRGGDSGRMWVGGGRKHELDH